MKLSILLPLAVTASAIVILEDEVMQQIAIEDHSKHGLFQKVEAALPSKDKVLHVVEGALDSVLTSTKNALDDAFEWATDAAEAIEDPLTQGYFDAKAWLASSLEEGREHYHHGKPPPPPPGPPKPPGKPPHHAGPPPPPPPPPPHGPPHHDGPPPPPPHGPPHHGPDHDHDHDHPHRPGHDKPHHPPHHKPDTTNYTVYELIAGSKYTTKLAALINEIPDLVDLLNGTSANFTVFAPTDAAFEKIPDHHKKPSKELIAKLLSYHVSGEFYPAGRILVSRTVPTLLEGKYLSEDPKDTPQRISTNIGFRGLTLNFYSRVVAVNVFGSNGVIHGIDSLLLPPPSTARIITLLPSEFSTLELGLRKTDLFDAINSTTNHLGGTFFAPSNWAFTKLGPKINAFLFSEYGRKYLAALLKYHVVANQTLYSDAFYSGGSSDAETLERHRIPKGQFHIDLPTLLEDRALSIDIGRYGRLIDVRINGFAHVSVPDGVAKDGVIHGLTNVLIPPKKVGGSFEKYQGEDISVEELKERLEQFVVDDDLAQEVNKHDL